MPVESVCVAKKYITVLNDISIIPVFLFKILFSSSIDFALIGAAQLFTRHAVHACSMLITIIIRALTPHKSFMSTICA